MKKYVSEVLKIQNSIVRHQSHIHNDIAFSILVKSSLKSLKRFGCVCKSWSLLFDDTTFMTAYRKNFLSNDHPYYNDKSLLLCQTIVHDYDDYIEHDDEYTFDLYSVFDERFENRVQLNWPKVSLNYNSGFDILGHGSVNGILFLICVHQTNRVLWNPSTGEFKVIPHSPFGPRLRVNYRGFGYDSVRDDFKILRSRLQVRQNSHCRIDMMPERDISFNLIWEIYSVRNNSWKKLDVDMHDVQMECEQLYIDGLSHWLCKNEPENKTYLLSFDWSNEVFLTTPLPSNVEGIFRESKVESDMVLLNGYIALVIIYKETNTFHFLILGEVGVKESWTKIFNVVSLPSFDCLIGAGKKGRMLFGKKDRQLAWFDINTQMIEDIDLYTWGSDFKILFHKENLLPFPFEGINL